MISFLSDIKWNEIITVNFTADDIWHSFQSILNEAIEMFVPHRIIRDANRGGGKRHRPKALSTIASQKFTKWKAYRRDPTNIKFREAYYKANAKYKRAVREYEVEKEIKVLNAGNPGAFFRFVNKKTIW